MFGVLILLVSILVTLVAGFAHGGLVSPQLDVLTHFAPFYLVFAILLVLMGGFVPVPGLRLAIFIVGVTGAVASLLLIGPEFARSRGRPAAPTPDAIKVIQFNAWGQNREGDRAVAWILAQNPDFILLQEGGQIRGGLAAHGYRTTCAACGSLIMSRSEPVVRDEVPVVNGRRLIAHATFRDHRGEFDVIAIHKSWPTRIARLRRERRGLENLLAGMPRQRLIVAGDFNSAPWSFTLRSLDRLIGVERRTRALASWPAGRLSHYRWPAPFPFMPIDHVYAGSGWETVEIRRGPRLGSDHYPVVVTLSPTP